MQNLVKGTTHLSLGMEAIATGFGVGDAPDDYTFAPTAGHAHTLARGMDLGAAMAELLGRENGCSAARAARCTSPSRRAGDDGLLRHHRRAPAVANGAAWSAQMRGTDRWPCASSATAPPTSARSTRRSTWPSGLEAAGRVRLREQPLHGVHADRRVTAVEHPAADRAAAYGLEPIVVDGNDPDACLPHRAARSAGAGRRGPRLIEAITYRHGGHSRADPGKYRPEEEVEAWLARDPDPALPRPAARPRRRPKRDAERDRAGWRGRSTATEFAKAGRAGRRRALDRRVWATEARAWRN
jgi:acetoin:2,6-dichlorophenolindophenol oxidoreductase subunit alpha